MTEVMLLILAVAYFARRGRGKPVTKDALGEMLSGAVTAGIITTAQRDALVAYGATHQPSAGRLGGAGWLAVCAGLFVVAGVSLLVARNWEDIGPTVRVGAFLVLLLGVGEAAIRSRERSLALALPLELVWMFLPLLGIGLYGQTFQLSGDAIQPYLAWLALAAPLAWLSPRPVVATLHTAGLVIVLFCGNYLIDGFSMLVGSGGPARGMLALTGEPANPAAWVLSVVILALTVLQSLRLLPEHHRHHCVGVVAVWVFGVLIAPTPLHVEHPGWIILAALSLATLWVVVLAYLETSFEERAAATAIWLGSIYVLTFLWHMTEPADGDVSRIGGGVIIGAIALALAATAMLPLSRLSPRPGWGRLAKLALSVPIAVALLFLADDMQLVWLAAAAMNVILFAMAIGLMWHGSLVHEPSQINAGVLVLVAMLITRFLDVFRSMLQSGIGLIAAGALLAGLAWALERTRRRLIGGPA